MNFLIFFRKNWWCAIQHKIKTLKLGRSFLINLKIRSMYTIYLERNCIGLAVCSIRYAIFPRKKMQPNISLTYDRASHVRNFSRGFLRYTWYYSTIIGYSYVREDQIFTAHCSIYTRSRRHSLVFWRGPDSNCSWVPPGRVALTVVKRKTAAHACGSFTHSIGADQARAGPHSILCKSRCPHRLLVSSNS